MDLCFLKNLKGRATTKSLAASITHAIDNGLLKSGEKLPSSREIAQLTGTSRTTVVRTFDELIARGYLNGRKGQATFVSDIRCDTELLSFEPPVENNPPTFSGLLPLDMLPAREWQKTVAMQVAKLMAVKAGVEKRTSDLQDLKSAICGFVRRTDGILCSPANIAIFSGTASAMESIARMTDNEGVACENKGSAIYELFRRHGAHVSELSIDSAGARIDAMGTSTAALKWLSVTPSGSRPSGIILSDARRYELIEWARINSGIIIENATGAEFQYTNRSTPSLFSQDRSGSIVYHRSLTGLLHPLANLEFLIIPDRLMDRFHDCYSETSTPPTVEHLALADFINNGLLEKHIRATWKVLRRRRQMLIFALKQRFDTRAEIYASHAGTQIVVRFDSQWSLPVLIQAAQAAGLKMTANDRSDSQKEAFRPEFIIDFSALEEEKTERLIETFAALLFSTKAVVTATPLHSATAVS